MHNQGCQMAKTLEPAARLNAALIANDSKFTVKVSCDERGPCYKVFDSKGRYVTVLDDRLDVTNADCVETLLYIERIYVDAYIRGVVDMSVEIVKAHR